MHINQPNVLRLGTRGSLLASRQSQGVADQLQLLWPNLKVELKIIKTTGDRVTDRQLHDIGGKGLFTKELELALLNREIDLAVHSYKDVPVTMPLVDESELVIAAVPKREDVSDVLIAGEQIRSIDNLPKAARVGTGSLRRHCQLLHLRPDLRIVPIRGNIDTRLKKQQIGELDAVILAAAGLVRAGLFDISRMRRISPEMMVPAAGQGALALQCRGDDTATQNILRAMNDPDTESCTAIERTAIALLNADCHSPIGVYAQSEGPDTICVHFAIGDSSLSRVDRFSISAPITSIRDEMKQKLSEKRMPKP